MNIYEAARKVVKTGSYDDEDGQLFGGVCVDSAAFQLLRAALTEACTWAYDDDMEYYDGDCDGAWRFRVGTAEANGVAYCPKCGRPVVLAELER